VSAATIAIETACWVCHQPATWKVTAEKQGEPTVIVVFWACEKCVPFAYVYAP
jgi:hypothetical protein